MQQESSDMPERMAVVGANANTWGQASCVDILVKVQVRELRLDMAVVPSASGYRVSVMLPGVAHSSVTVHTAGAVGSGTWDMDSTVHDYHIAYPVDDKPSPPAEPTTDHAHSKKLLRQKLPRTYRQRVLPEMAARYIRRTSRKTGLHSRQGHSVDNTDQASGSSSNTQQDSPLPPPISALEFVVWAQSGHGDVYVGECAFPVQDWIKNDVHDVSWPSAQPVWLRLFSADGQVGGSLQVRVGLAPAQSQTDDNLSGVYSRMCDAAASSTYGMLRRVSAVQSVGMVDEDDEVMDVYLTDCSSSDSDDTENTSSVSDATQEDGMSGTLSDTNGSMTSDLIGNLKSVSLVDDALRAPSTHSQQMRSLAFSDSGRRSRARRLRLPRRSRLLHRQTRSTSPATPRSESRSHDAVPSSRGWRLRSRGPHSASETHTALSAQDLHKRKPRRAIIRRRSQAKTHLRGLDFAAELGRDILGIVVIEIVSAHALPRWRNLTYTSFDMDPFVVVSFHRKVFRTRVCRHTLDPVWRQKLTFHVHRAELDYSVQCAVYDWDSISANDYVGEVHLDMAMLVDQAPKPDPATGLYDPALDNEAEMVEFNLPLQRDDHLESVKFGSGPLPTLQVRAIYRPCDALRQRFWREMLRLYDSNDDGRLNMDELQSMLLTLGSTLTPATIAGFFERFNLDPSTEELTWEQGVRVLEDELQKPWNERRRSMLPNDSTPPEKLSTGLGEMAEAMMVDVDVDDDDTTDPGTDEHGVLDDIVSKGAGAAPGGAHDVSPEEGVERVIRLRSCPLCDMPRLSQAHETDIVTHLALCSSRKGHAVNDIMVSSFVTASQARRKWYTNMFTKLSQGRYHIGANSANILVQDRRTGQLVEEKMQIYVRLSIRLLYQGAQGRMAGSRARRMLRSLSVRQGLKYDHPSSTRAIGPFIQFYGIAVSEMVDPVDSFATFNEFFCRRIDMSLRPIADADDPQTLVSCADCRMLAFPSVERATQLWIKGWRFSVARLLGAAMPDDPARSDPMALVIFRLAPQDYHRFHAPIDARIGAPVHIPGEYYTVNPMAIRSVIDVYGENARVVIPMYSPVFGTAYLVAVGAMMVGSIVLSVQEGDVVRRGDELGYFKFGGSTLVLLVGRDMVEFDADLLANTEAQIETLVQPKDQGASQAMLYATKGIGSDEDLKRAMIGVASVWYEGNPCNAHLFGVGKRIRQSVEDAGLTGYQFGTVGVSDGISMGTSAMSYSLPSRDLIADSVESCVGGHWLDGCVVVPGCDKNMPGVLMALGRLNRPGIMVYGGTIRPGSCASVSGSLDIVSAFQSYGQYLAAGADEAAEKIRYDTVRHACPGNGACGGMYTANTMASCAEVLGMTLPGSSSFPAEYPEKQAECDAIGDAMRNLLEQNIRPRDIMTKSAFEDAITLTMVLGGSTNVVLHLIAIAKSVGVDLTIDDFQRISDKTPFLANLKPSGKYVMEDVYNILGGIPSILHYLIENKMIKGEHMTVTGRTLRENCERWVAERGPMPKDQDVLLPIENPIKESGHIRVLYGNLAPGGAVAKITGKEGLHFTGKARVFDTEDAMVQAVEQGTIKKGEKTVVILRYKGPKGGPGMPEMLKPTSLIMGAGLGYDVACLTDGRFSGGSHGFVIGHVVPEAQEGGPIALVQDGDEITIDAEKNSINITNISDEELQRRRSEWTPRPLPVTQGGLLKYTRLVSDASHGCVTDAL